MAENGASALRQEAPAERSSLGPRIASALVLVPLALVLVWVGGLWFTLLAAVAAGIMAWEWGRLVGGREDGLEGALLVAAAAGAVLVAGQGGVVWGGVTAMAALAALQVRASAVGRGSAWLLGGLAWIIGPSIGLVWLRGLPDGGLASVYWVLALVWSVDSMAYAAGRSIGGPRLAPRISPRKTWSGLLGGMMAAIIVGAVTALAADGILWWRLALLSGGLAIVEQIGDIAESYAKRRFGAKDSGSLIPGHGGLLDRLDGMLAVVAAVAIISLIMGGSVVPWR